ncbi:MAG: TonB-dependent receptor [Betaproteobacteria bacterium]|nr:MAG: TonB-dependent receptor [Betaproteobacteria bacterium]
MRKRDFTGASLVLSLAGFALARGAACAENPAEQLETPVVEVIGVTPLPGFGVPAAQVPANVQAVTGAEIMRQHPLSLPEFMSRRLSGVNVNENQGNPFQPDLTYRGFAASPLLGMPQGISVYQDGVRINEPFGDTVNWDLIPTAAISTINLIPGSNPLFGLNTLGGALSIRTKSGAQYPGTAATLYGGSFGRRSVDVQRGGANGEFDYFVSASAFREDGWRVQSPSDVRQFFSKLGWQDGTTDIDFSITHAESDLTGNGLLPQSMLRADPKQIYTLSDHTRNRMTLLTLNATRWLTGDLLWSGTAYYRGSGKNTINGDVNEVSDPRNNVTGYDDGDPNASSVNRTRTRQRGYGFSTQAALTSGDPPGRGNLVIVGGGYDRSASDFRQSYQLGGFNADRSTAPTGAETEIVDLDGGTSTASLFVTDTHSPNPRWHLTGSARYNVTRVRTADGLSPPLPPPAAGLGSDLSFAKLNPAVGAAYTPEGAPGFYAGFSQGNRPPSPVELGCADRNSPCHLPNAMASDPPLKQVVARTIEVGARARTASGLRWNAALFRTMNYDDILFVSSSVSSGFFTNFGKTRRQGLEAALERLEGKFSWALNYSLIDATYRSSAALFSQANSTADANGDIQVSPGDRIPGIPRHHLNAAATYDLTDRTTVGAGAVAVSRQVARGNDNNRHQPDGVNFLGPGEIAGYAIFNLNLDYKLDRGLRAFAKLANVFGRRYATAGALQQNFFPGGNLAAPGAQVNETFYAPGAPRALWIGIQLTPDAAAGRQARAAQAGRD